MKVETFNWLLQRISAVYLFFIIFFLGYFALFDNMHDTLSVDNHLAVFPLFDVLFSHPFLMISLLFLFLVHGFLGIKVVMEDYISSVACRRLMEISLAIFIVVTMLVAFYTFFFLFHVSA